MELIDLHSRSNNCLGERESIMEMSESFLESLF